MLRPRRPVLNCIRVFSSIIHRMCREKIIPDVIDVSPENIIEVSYPSIVDVCLGNVLTPTQVKNIPTVDWLYNDCLYYTLCMTDPDAPSRKNPEFREWHHWLVGNIPGNDVDRGETLSEYIGAGPPRGTGLHRYIFLVYKQKSKLKFDEPRLKNNSANNRGKFSIRKFAFKYCLGQPFAGNFFQAEYDDYVLTLYKQLNS